MVIAVTIVVTLLLAALPVAAALSPRAARVSGRVAGQFKPLVRAVFAVATWSSLVLLVVQLAVVILVSVFSVSVIWLQESTAYLFAAIFLLGAGGVFLTDGHVRVDVLSTHWSARRQAMIDLGGITLLLLPVCALIVIVSVPWAARSWAELERSGEPSGLHLVYILKSMVPAFAIVLSLAAFVRADEAARLVRRS